MRTNLLLLTVIVAGGWYLFYPAAPEPAPVPATSAPVHRADFGGVHTFYSTLNDPAVPVSSTHSTQPPVATGNGLAGSTSLSLGATSAVNRNGSGDGSNLNISQRSADIARTARGE